MNPTLEKWIILAIGLILGIILTKLLQHILDSFCEDDEDTGEEEFNEWIMKARIGTTVKGKLFDGEYVVFNVDGQDIIFSAQLDKVKNADKIVPGACLNIGFKHYEAENSERLVFEINIPN